MRKVKIRRFVRDTLPRMLLALAMFALLGYLATFEGVRYWAWEIGASLAIDALVYVFLPFMAIGIVCTLLKHWRVVMREFFGIFREVVALLVP